MSRRRTICASGGTPHEEYLRVTPEILWVTGDFLITSNTDWTIE